MAAEFSAWERLKRTTNLPTDTTSFTWMGWVNPDVINNNVIFDFGDDTSGNNGELTLYVFTSGTSIFKIRDGTNNLNASTSTISTGTWYHVAVTCAGTGASDLKFYFNGTLESSNTGVNHSGAQLTISGESNTFNRRFDGKLAAVKVYDAVLTAEEIQQEKNFFLPQTNADSLKVWLPFNQAADFEVDYSGNGAFTELNTGISSVENPPISWGYSRDLSFSVSAAAGGGGEVLQTESGGFLRGLWRGFN